jgi:hypothetical protein
MASFNKVHVKKLYIPNAHATKKAFGRSMGQVTATADELNIMDGVTSTAAELNIMDGVTATAAELNLNDTQTATAAEVNQLDASVNGALMTVGTGISAAAAAIVKYGIFKSGTGIVTTKILIDITGLQSGGTNDDIFGDPTGGGTKSHLGQLTTAINGVNWGGDIRCFETPAGCNIDVDLSCASVDTGVQDADVTALTNYAQLLDGGNQAGFAATQPLTAVIPADYYLYLSAGTTTDVVASAGRFLLTLYGYVA